MMNSTDAPCFFPPCGSYEPPPQPPGAQWGWPRQDMGPGYPYYADSSTTLQPSLTHQALGSIPPPDSSSTAVSGATVCGSTGGVCSATSSDCRVGGTGGYNTPGGEPSSERRGSKDEPQSVEPHSNERDEDLSGPHSSMKQEATSSDNGKKKRDRFNGMTEEEVLKKTVPDLLAPNLDIIIIGSCPGLTAAYLGHHYAGPGNHFWKCLYLSGLIPEPMNACDDYKLKQFGIGFTNFIARCSKGSVEFSRREIKEGVESLTEKIQTYKPKIAVFNGKGIYEVFCNHKNFYIGKQPEPFPGTNTVVYVMPSSSARCSQLPRASDKVPFFVALRKLRDHLRGCLPHLDESEIVFPDLDLKVEPRKDRRPADESGRTPGVSGSGGSTAVSESIGSASGSAEHKDRKRRSVDCNYNDMVAANDRLYRPGGLASSFTAAMSSEMPQEFKWGAGFQKWPAPPGFGGFGSHPFAGAGAGMAGPVAGSSRSADCTYEAMLAAKQQEERLNQLRSFSSGHAAGAWPYTGWGVDPAFQHRWTMHGLANRFGNDPMSSRYAIPPYLQYPDMISSAGDRLSAAAGHHLGDGRPGGGPAAMYPSFYNPGSFQPGEAAAAAAAASAFTYNPALAHHDMKAASQLDPTGFLPRPSYTPPSYYPQYR